MSNINEPIDYDREDASVELLHRIEKNREDERLKEAAQREQKMRDEAAQRAIAKSVGNTVKRIKYDEKRSKELERERKNKIKAIVGTTLIVISLTLGIVAVKGEEIKKDFQTSMAADSYIYSLVNVKENILQKKGLAVLDYRRAYPLLVLDNSVQDYRELNISSIEDVYLYMKILDTEEFNKFIQAVSYYDTDTESDTYGQKLYYQSFKDFLNINGFKNKIDFVDKLKDSYISIIENRDTIDNSSIHKGGR